MRFTLTHNAQGKEIGPVTLNVQPEPRKDYKHSCHCRGVFAVARESVTLLIEKKLVLESQRGDKQVVCSCLGMLEGRPDPVTPVLDRPLVSWDCETTGVDPVLDRLVQLGVTVLIPDGTRKRWETLINPEMPIPPGVTEIHGITDEMVKDAPTFDKIAAQFAAGLRGKDMLLYNGRRLDLPVVDESLRRAGMKLDLEGVRVIDVFGIFQKREPRNLEAAVKRYCDRAHRGAHGAQADSEETLEVYLGMLGEYGDMAAMTLDEQATHCLYGDDGRLPCDIAGKLYLKDGEVYFGFGKAKDKRVRDDTGYAMWILKASDPPFPGSTREKLTEELKRIGAL